MSAQGSHRAQQAKERAAEGTPGLPGACQGAPKLGDCPGQESPPRPQKLTEFHSGDPAPPMSGWKPQCDKAQSDSAEAKDQAATLHGTEQACLKASRPGQRQCGAGGRVPRSTGTPGVSPGQIREHRAPEHALSTAECGPNKSAETTQLPGHLSPQSSARRAPGAPSALG